MPPMTNAAHGSILSQQPVIETNPTKAPQHKAPQSYLFTKEYVPKSLAFTNTATTPPTEPEMTVFIMILAGPFALGTKRLFVLPPLKNSHATHRIKVPVTTKV